MTAITAARATPVSPARCPCAHCGLEVPPALRRDGEQHQFCCQGCETVWAVHHTAGLASYYAIREAAGASPAPAATSGGAFEEFDDPAHARLFVTPKPGGLAETEFLLEGVHCAACVWLVERLGAVCPGVVESRLNMGRSVVTITYRPDLAAPSRLARGLDRLGYHPHAARGRAARDLRAKEDRAHLVRVAVAGACAGNVMLLSTALYAGAFSGIEPIWESLFRWASAAIGLLCLAWPGRVFFRSALAALRTGRAHLDVPIALALAAGAVWGSINTLRGTGEIYFDSLCVLVFLLLVGRWVQHRQQRSATDSVELMLMLTPTTATVVDAGRTQRRVPIEAVEPGDTVRVLAGDTVPADGTVLEGDTHLDRSLLTGESVPIAAGRGQTVAAGTVNLSAPILVRVDAVGEATRVGRLVRTLSDAARRRVPVVRAADRLAGWFVVIVLAMAGLTAALWAHAGPAAALDHATALLIVACHCALGLATPMAMGVACGRAAKAGALIKDASALQTLATPGVMLLDKTGTITHAKAALIRWHGDPALGPLVARLEGGSRHPAAEALARAFPPNDLPEPEGVVHTPGGGVRGTVNGVDLIVGSRAYVLTQGGAIEPWAEVALAGADAAGHTGVAVAVDGAVRAVAELGDPIREDAAPSIRRLHELGWEVRVLSGDSPGVVRAVARGVGVDEADARGGASPEAKAEVVRELVASGRRVVMVGDGVNDAAALAGATAGIAVHGGAEASLEAADVYLAREGLAPLVELVERSRATMRSVRFVLGVSVTYNALAASLAMAGVMNALVAAVIMPISSIVAVSIASTAGRLPGKERR